MKQMPTATLIYNSRAGALNLQDDINLIVKMWQQRGWQLVVQPTQFAGHATLLARRATAAKHEVVIAAGGDGTLGEVANGLVYSQTALAPLPIGTANSFAREVGLPSPHWLNPSRLLDASALLLNGRIQTIDLGYTSQAGDETNGRYWVLWSGVGADSFFVNQLEPRPEWSKKMGRTGYILQCLNVLPQLPSMFLRVEVDDRPYTGEFVLSIISNCRLYGGLVVLNPQAKLDDGQLEVWLFRGRGAIKLFQSGWRMLLNNHHEHPDVIMTRGRKVTIQAPVPLPIHVDGDKAGSTPLVCQIKPAALNVVVPATASTNLFHGQGRMLSVM